MFYSNIVSYPFDFADEEVAENYVSFLKSLATNVSSDKLIGFILDNNFSLYAGARMFINNKDTLIKTAARTVILTILKCKKYLVQHERVTAYIIDSGFIFHIINILKEQIYSLDRVVKLSSHAKLDVMINDCIDTLYYLSDMLEQLDPVFTDKLSNAFVLVLSPVLIGSLVSEVHGSFHVAIHVAFYLLVQIFRIFKHTWLLDIYAVYMLGENISVLLLDICNNPPPNNPPEFFDVECEAQEFNPGRNSLLSFLKCRYDTLVCLALLLLQGIAINKEISTSVMVRIKLRHFSSSFVRSENREEGEGEAQTYDTELLQSLMQVYGTYPLFRFNSYLLVSRIVFELCCGNSQKKILEYEYFTRKICCDNIVKLQKLLVSKEFSDVFLDYFDEEWENVRKIDFSAYIGIQNHNILPVVSEESKVALEHKQPGNDFELIRSLIKLFFLMRKLILKLNSEDSESYPFKYSSRVGEWQCGDAYCTNGIGFIRVFMKNNEEIVRYIAEDDDFFVIVEPDLNRIEYATVVSVEKWRNLEVRKDEKNYIVNLATRTKKKIDFTLSFESPETFYIETEKMQLKIANSRFLEMSLAESFLVDSHDKLLDKYA